MAVLGVGLLQVPGSAGEGYNVQETRLGIVHEHFMSPAFSNDGCHFAYVIAKGKKWCVVVDVEAGDGVVAFGYDVFH